MQKTENIFSENKLPALNERIKMLINHYASGSVKLFSEYIKLSSSQKLNRIFNIDKRNGDYPEASTDILLSIANMFSDINMRWLLTGNGDMFLSPKSELTKLQDSNQPCPSCIEKERTIKAKEELISTQLKLINRLEDENESLKAELDCKTHIKKVAQGD